MTPTFFLLGVNVLIYTPFSIEISSVASQEIRNGGEWKTPIGIVNIFTRTYIAIRLTFHVLQ